MATVLQWLKQENFHMPAAMLAARGGDQKLEVAAPARGRRRTSEALLQLAMAQAHGVPSEKIAALGGPHDVDLLAEWKSTRAPRGAQTLAATATVPAAAAPAAAAPAAAPPKPAPPPPPPAPPRPAARAAAAAASAAAAAAAAAGGSGLRRPPPSGAPPRAAHERAAAARGRAAAATRRARRS